MRYFCFAFAEIQGGNLAHRRLRKFLQWRLLHHSQRKSLRPTSLKHTTGCTTLKSDGWGVYAYFNDGVDTDRVQARSRRGREAGLSRRSSAILRVQARSRGGRWSWTHKLAQERSRAGRWSWAGDLDFFRFSCFPTAEQRTWSLRLCSA